MGVASPSDSADQSVRRIASLSSDELGYEPWHIYVQKPSSILQWKDIDSAAACWHHLSTVKICLALHVAEQTRTQGLRVEAVAAVNGRIASMSDQEPSAFSCRSQ
jgi:hypothetical protein